MHHIQKRRVRDRGVAMKALVNLITIIAMLAIMTGGAAIESESFVPFLLIGAGAAWFLLRIGATHMHMERKEER